MIKKKIRLMSELERSFMFYIKINKIPIPKQEYKFDKEKKWRFDFAWPDKKVAVELEGGVFTYGGHNRITGFIKDCEKYNKAALLGWKVLRYPSNKLEQAIFDLKEVLC